MDGWDFSMKETKKASRRRMFDWKFTHRYFVGDGIDIGSGDDPLCPHWWFPQVSSVRQWDLEDGDANVIDELVPHGSFDFVHASNVLEHMIDPEDALKRWLRILRIGGHLIFTVPDEDIYEQRVFPSTWNEGHLHTFTIHKQWKSWSPVSIDVIEMLLRIRGILIKKISLEDNYFDYEKERTDQTFDEKGAEAFIEVVVQKIAVDHE